MKSTPQKCSIGFDIGTHQLKCCLVESTRLIGSFSMPSGLNIRKRLKKCTKELLRQSKRNSWSITCRSVTGFGAAYSGSTLLKLPLHDCLAAATASLDCNCRTIVDIGSFFITIIKVTESGEVSEYIQNEKCAIGSGRFLEIVLKNCGLSWHDVPEFDLPGQLRFTQTCAIFAESEMISMLNRNVPPIEVFADVLFSIKNKAQTLMNRIEARPPVLLTGGVLQNEILCRKLKAGFNCETKSPSMPQFMAAYGAALIAQK